MLDILIICKEKREITKETARGVKDALTLQDLLHLQGVTRTGDAKGITIPLLRKEETRGEERQDQRRDQGGMIKESKGHAESTHQVQVYLAMAEAGLATKEEKEIITAGEKTDQGEAGHQETTARRTHTTEEIVTTEETMKATEAKRGPKPRRIPTILKFQLYQTKSLKNQDWDP